MTITIPNDPLPNMIAAVAAKLAPHIGKHDRAFLRRYEPGYFALLVEYEIVPRSAMGYAREMVKSPWEGQGHSPKCKRPHIELTDMGMCRECG